MKKTGELSRARRLYKFYLAAALILLIGIGFLYWTYAPVVTMDIVLAVALFVLVVSNIQTFHLVFELEERVEELEKKQK